MIFYAQRRDVGLDPMEAFGEMIDDARRALEEQPLPELPQWIRDLLHLPEQLEDDSALAQPENLAERFAGALERP